MDSKYKPAYDPAHSREPTEAERKVDLVFQRFIEDEIKLESNEEMIRRDSVLAEVRKIFLDWVQFVAQQILHIPSDVAEDAGGELFISGSHRLGVRDIGADIDTVCVAPNFCTREHFFTYLKEDLLKRSEVTAFNAVEDAFVPIISFDFRGVSIDLLFARLATNTVPRDLDILDDSILIGLDDATEKSLNGPRVTNMIFKLVGEKTFPNFLIVLRCIRKWAKRRGIYGNKLGYLGGVNCNILVAFICQLYPNFAPSALLFRFFKHYRTWNWPEPIMLNNIQQNPFGQMGVTHERMVWSPVANPNDLMPIITPAYPAMNSAFNVNTHTLLVMQNELSRGYEICESILKKNAWQDMNNWKKLFDPSDFFLRYPHYLACHIVGTGENEESRSWIGFVESRIRRFIQHPFLQTLPLLPPIHLYPVMSKTSKSANSICYFIGFHIDYDLMSKLGDNNLRIDECVARFQETLLDPDRGYKGERVEGLDFYVEHLTWKKLPKETFEVYGGYEQAKQLREEMGFNNKRVQINVSNLVAETKEVPEATTSSGKQLLQQQQGQLQQQKATGAKVQVLEKKDEIAEFKKKAEKYGVEFEKVREIYFPTNKAEKGDELRKRFMAAAVGVESSKRRRTDGIIIKDVFPVDKESQIPYAIPTITWNLFEK